MSPNLSADRRGGDRSAIHAADLLLALLLHLIAAALIGAWALWQRQHAPEPPARRLEVALISASQLDRLQRPHRAAPRPAPHKPRAKPPRSKPAPKIRPKPEAVASPRPKPRPKPHPEAKPQPAFDPFAPLESPDDRNTRSAPERRMEPVELPGQRLSQSELERYIARIRARVQAHWKTPAELRTVRDPLVEMRLAPDGSVVSARVVESSGNAALDASLIRAIHAAAPFDLPREHFSLFRVNRIRFHPLR